MAKRKIRRVKRRRPESKGTRAGQKETMNKYSVFNDSTNSRRRQCRVTFGCCDYCAGYAALELDARGFRTSYDPRNNSHCLS